MLAEPGQEGGHGADLVPGLAGGGARAGAGLGTVAQAPQDPPGQVGLHEPPVGGVIDAGEDVPAPSFYAGQGLVAGGKDAGGGQHVPQVIGGPLVRMVIQRLMGEGCAAGGDVGEDRGGGSGPQPVERRVRGPRGRDGLDDAIQRGGEVRRARPGRVLDQGGGSLPQAAAGTSALLE